MEIMENRFLYFSFYVLDLFDFLVKKVLKNAN